MRPIRVGAQLFVNRHDTPEQVETQVRLMAESGFTLLRIFLVWDHLEPREGAWQWHVYDSVFKAAAAHRIGVVATLMAVSPPGWMRRTQGLQDVGDLDDPKLWARSLDYVSRVVNRWAAAPALDSWILWNEPARVLSRQDTTLEHFRSFLARKYETISALNRLYFRQYESFSSILAETTGNSYALGFGSRVEEVDWLEFTTDHLMHKLQELADAVRALDAAHPLHVNPHRISQCLADSGQSVWREAEIVDFMGFSAHPPWHSVRFPEDRIQQSVGMFADLVRSATRHPEGRFWCTELQGGPTVMTAFRPSSPTSTDIARWMWESAASGAEAIVFWCFNTREDGYEAGEWSLCHLDGTPSPRLETASRLAHFFREHEDWFSEARPVADIAILHSEASQILGVVEGEGDDVHNPRNRQMVTDAACGAYLMASDLSWEVSFVNEGRIREGQIPARILFAPACTVLDEETFQAIASWVRAGGILIADAPFGWKNADGSLARAQWPRHANLFGTEAKDFQILTNASFSNGAITAGGWFFRIHLEPEAAAAVLAQWPDGTPATVEKHHGKGRALRIGTAFFQRYMTEPTEGSRRLLESWLASHLSRPVWIVSPAPGSRLRRLRTPQGFLGTVFGAAYGMTEIAFAKAGCWQIAGCDWHPIPEDRLAVVPLDADGVACIRAEFAEAP
jgi:beta-galactosidase